MGRKIFAGAALGLGIAVAATAAPHGRRAAVGPDESARQLMQSCEAHKFETLVKTVVDGQPHESKVKLCGKEGQSDAEWIGTLKDAIAKLNANKDMPAAVRDQIVTAINAEIGRLQIGQAVKPETPVATALPPPRQRPQPSAVASDEYASLPPLPTAPPPPPHVIGPGGQPTPVFAGGSKSTPLPLAAGPAPKLSFACYSPGDIGDGAPCTGFQRETMLTILAGEDIGRGVNLRFARNGEERASVDLPELRRGKSMQIALPQAVCQGVGDGRLDLELVRNGELLKSEGPYSLRC